MRVRPPLVPRQLASWLLTEDAREVVVGDLDEAFARRVAGGMPEPRARRLYWREALGSLATIYRARVRGVAGAAEGNVSRGSLMQGLWLDIRYVVRALAASRGFTIVAVLSLAIGIGATTALVNVARTLLVTRLPVARPDELSWVFWSADLHMRLINFGDDNVRSGGRTYDSNYSYPLYQAVKAAAGSRVEIAGINVLRQINLSSPGRPAALASGLLVSGDFFETLRLPVALGRPLALSDAADGAPAVVVLTDACWRRTFGGDPRAIGASVSLNGALFEVVGVTTPAFDGLSRGGLVPPADVLVSMAAQPIVAPSWRGTVPLRDDFNRQWIRMIARVADPSARAELEGRATAALRAALTGVAPADADLRGVDVRLFQANRGLDTLGNSATEPLAALTGVVIGFLLVACSNLAGMLTARGLARRREFAVRRALGASRWRLVRQTLIESVLLAAAGGAAGTLLTIWAGPALTAMLSDGLRASPVRLPIDWTFLAMAAAVSIGTALVFGVAPALRMTRDESTRALRDRGATAAGAGRHRSGRVLIAVQLAVSLPLLVGALLFLRTLYNFSTVPLGFDPHGLVLFEINPVRTAPTFGTDPIASADAQRVRDILARLEALPGVTSATVLENALVSGRSSNFGGTIDGQRVRLMMQAVGPDFFATMGMPLLAGRGIAKGDGGGAPGVTVINESAARQYFPGRSPIGRTLTVSGWGPAPDRTLEIVGVVADARYDSLRNSTRPTVYDSYLQRPGGTYASWFAVRVGIAPSVMERPIRDAVAGVDPNLPITHLRTQQEQIDQSIGRERVLSRLLTLFGAFALLLASLGLHGLTSYAVARRTSEIGIRLALGAQRSQVLWLVLRQVLALAAVGLAVGVPLAWAAGPLVGSYLFGVAPRDLLTMALAGMVLTLVTLVAGWLPARRAARMDPLAALRVE